MLTCRQLTELVTDYLEGRLRFMQRMSFQMHIGMCKHCRAYLRQMRLTVRTLGRMPDAPIPAAVREELLARFRKARPWAAAAIRPVPWSVGLLAAIEKAVGSTRGWVLAGLMLSAVLLYTLGSGLRSGPAGEALQCVLTEIGVGGAFLAALVILASAKRARLSPATWTVVPMTGSLIGFGFLEAMCPMGNVALHVLLFHVGGIALAGALGLAASRLPALR